jgi:N-acetylmuramoyl-L-alanine amidase
MSRKKIGLDAGHGGKDPGATDGGMKEKDFNLTLTKLIKEKLSKYDVDIVETRQGDETVSLKERTDFLNKENVDLVLSIHANAGGGQGYEDFIFSGTVSSLTVKYRDILHDEVSNSNSMINRGKKRANFHMLRETKAPAILTENGFVDNVSDRAKMRNSLWLNQVSDAYVRAIVRMFNLKKKENDKMYYVQIGAFKNKNNAKLLAEKAKKDGYNVYIKEE